jgi:hypothetical protein
MEKSTKLIIAAIGLGGLGFFLYKKGLFGKKTIAEVAKDVKKDVVDVVTPKDVVSPPPPPVDTGKKTAVEPLMKDCVQVGYDCTTNTYNTIQIPIDADCNDYQPAMPPCAPRGGGPGGGEDFIKLYEPIGFRDNTYVDQPTRIDYTSGKYNQDVYTDYMVKDISNARFNQLLYA